VLGAVLIAPEALSVVRGKVGADDFSFRNRPIYLGILSLADNGKPADLITLTDELRDRGLLDQCGGAAYISSLTSAIPTAANVAYYADIVQEAAAKRRFLHLSNTIKEQITSPGSDVTGIIEKIRAEIDGIERATGIVTNAVNLRTMEDILAYKDPEPLIEGLIPRHSIVVLSGWTGDGKTLVSHEVERSVCDGFPVFGNPAFNVHRPGMVILFDEETPAPMLKERLVRMGFHSALPFRVGHFTGLRLDDENHFQIILALIGELRPELIVFDSLIRFHTQEENDASGMAPIMGRLRQLANLTTVIVIHHTVKADVDIRKRSRGSGDIIAGVDLELSLTKTAEGDLLIQSAKSRGRPIEPFRLRIEDTFDGGLVVTYRGTERAPAERLGDVVAEALADGQLAFAEIGAALTEKGITTSRRSLQRAIANLCSQNSMHVVVGTRGKKTYSLNPDAHEVRR